MENKKKGSAFAFIAAGCFITALAGILIFNHSNLRYLSALYYVFYSLLLALAVALFLRNRIALLACAAAIGLIPAVWTLRSDGVYLIINLGTCLAFELLAVVLVLSLVNSKAVKWLGIIPGCLMAVITIVKAGYYASIIMQWEDSLMTIRWLLGPLFVGGMEALGVFFAGVWASKQTAEHPAYAPPAPVYVPPAAGMKNYPQTPVPPAAPRFCGKCGAKNTAGSAFCQSCGAPLQTRQ